VDALLEVITFEKSLVRQSVPDGLKEVTVPAAFTQISNKANDLLESFGVEEQSRAA
jgi:hypothetical protein